MTLQVSGKISMQDPVCIKCNEPIRIFVKSNIIKCPNCGALYDVVSSELRDQDVLFTYEFSGFRCVYDGLDKCDGTCPAPFMFCSEHVKDEYFTRASSEIRYVERRLEEAKEKLSRMEESKKTWMIAELSGIDEESDAVSKDKIR